MWAVAESDLASLAPVDVSEPKAPGEAVVISTAHVVHHAPSRATIRTYSRIGRGPGRSAYDVVLLPDDAAAAGAGGGGAAAGLSAALGAAARRARFPVDRPAYQHSFAVTAEYAVLVEQPLLFSLPATLWNVFAGDTALHMFAWEGGGAGAQTFFRVIRLADLAEVARVPAPPFFTFHVVNAFQVRARRAARLEALRTPRASPHRSRRRAVARALRSTCARTPTTASPTRSSSRASTESHGRASGAGGASPSASPLQRRRPAPRRCPARRSRWLAPSPSSTLSSRASRTPSSGCVRGSSTRSAGARRRTRRGRSSR